MSVRADRRAAARTWAPWLIPVVALGAFLAPMVVTNDGFMPDWTNHLWLVDQQAKAIDATGPTLYIHASHLGVFYPHFAFYGGTLYALTAVFALLLGDTTVAYVASWAAAFAAAYGGTTWLSMQCGLRGWRAQIPGLFLVTSAYFVTNTYGRGAWPEFVAVAVIPLLVASGLHLLRARWTPLPLLAFAGSTIVFSGSHNITLLYGVVFLAPIAAVVAIAAWRRPTPLEIRRGLALVGVAVLCVGINLWFLLPDVWYANRTRFGVGSEPFAFGTQRFLSALDVLFHPGRVSYPELENKIGSAIYLQLPVLAFVWIVAAFVVLRARATRFQRRMTWGLAVVAVPFAVLVATTEPWHWLPKLLRNAQFGYRLETYVIFAATGLVIVALCELGKAPTNVVRPLVVSLGLLMVVSSALAIWQVWNPVVLLKDRSEVLAPGPRVPRSWYDGGVYRDDSPDTPVLDAPRGFKRQIHFDVERARDGALTEVKNPHSGSGPILTNLAAGPYLVHVDGLDVVGRTDSGFLLLRRPAARPKGPITVHIGRPTTGAVQGGRVAAIGAAIALLAVVVWVSARSLGRRRRSATEAGPSPGDDGAEPAEGVSTGPPLVPTVKE
ncbi:MAG TPA: hypothetical protein VIH82_10865 [Acidimicrobiia bacterium]|jgi:hypothetical protein